jgi:DNA-binding NarL/FixJ family response regulator
MEPARLLVTSDQSLVGEAIAAALESRGYAVRRRPWTGPDLLAGGPGEPDGEIGLLLSDLEGPVRTRQVLVVLRTVPKRWLVLTSAPYGPLWGGLLEAGARLVGPSSVGLDELEEMLGSIALGRGTTAAERRSLVKAWHRLAAEQADLAARIATMTPRELQVLGFLYAGTPVRGIARRLSLAEATVRSLVQRVLRKLGVRTQLGAVAALCAAADPADQLIADVREQTRPMSAGATRSPKSGKARDGAALTGLAGTGMDASRRTRKPGEQG